jgi:hypothetical protein
MAAFVVVEQCSMSEARAKLRKLHIRDVYNLDCYILAHPEHDQRGRASLMSRIEALRELVGYFPAEDLLRELECSARL